MVSCQRYEGDISITLYETCRTQTLCPANMKYLQGRERVCVLNVCSKDFVLFVTDLAVSTCIFVYTCCFYFVVHVSLFVHVFVCQLYLSAK